MWQHYRMLGVVALLVLAGAYLFLPRVEERAAMLARDGYYESALREVAALPRAGARQAEVLMQIHALQRKEGAYPAAIATLQEYLLLRPHDFVAREHLSDLLLLVGDLKSYLDESRRLVGMRPDVDRVANLAGLYRLHGLFESEFQLLRDFSGTGHMRYQEHERLGALLAERADWSAAATWLVLADRKAPSNLSQGRLLLLDVLLQSHRSDEALQKSKLWMNTWRDAYLAVKLILGHSEAGDMKAALTLAQLSIDVMPNSVFEIAGALTRRGRPELARGMLSYWSDRAWKQDSDHWRDYVYATMQAGDCAEPFRMLSFLTERGGELLSRARLAEEIASAMGMSSFGSFRTALSLEVLQLRPLFAAQLALHEGNPQLSLRYFDAVKLDELSVEQKTVWLELLVKLEGADAIFARLRRLWDAKKLPPQYYWTFADVAMRTNQYRVHNAMWSSLAK